MSNNNYHWQGVPVEVIFGASMVKLNEEKPLMWHNYECSLTRLGGAYVPAIQVKTKEGRTFVLANHYGIGVHKLLHGGWPTHTHFSVSGRFYPDDTYLIKEFDLEGYQEHESARNKWMKENYPEEFKEIEELRQAARGLEKQLKNK